jgi:hypothetical protein
MVGQAVNVFHGQPTNGMNGGLAGNAAPNGFWSGYQTPNSRGMGVPFQGQQPNYGGLTSIMRNALGQPQQAPNYNPQPNVDWSRRPSDQPGGWGRPIAGLNPIPGQPGIGSFEQKQIQQMQPSPFKPFAGVQPVPPQMMPNNVAPSPRLWGHEGWLARGKVPY